MKRLALALAATVLASGCGSRGHCATSMTLSWDFLLYNGAVATSCATAGVQWVDVYLDGNLVVNGADCAPGGVVIDGVASGAHALTVEGIEPGGAIAYRHQLTANGPAGCGDVAVAVRPGEGTANLDYSTATGCTTSPCYLWFSVQDTVANVVASSISTSSAASTKVLFPYPQNVAIRLPEGTFSLDWMELVSGAGGAFTGEAITCSAVPFAVTAGVETPVAAPLACVPPT